jgi:aldehyde:ferredoxin oxidoreductase
MVENEVQLRDYYKAMGWNTDTGVPRKSVFKRLGLEFAIEALE